MASRTIYLPADLADRISAIPGFPLSAICQRALREHFAGADGLEPLDTVKTAAGRIEGALSDLRTGLDRLEDPRTDNATPPGRWSAATGSGSHT